MRNQEKSDLLFLLEDMEKSSLPETKTKIAEKLGHYYNSGLFKKEEIGLVHEIMHLLAKDAEATVRQSLANALKDNPNAPHDLILTLAKDIANVSEIVLEFSQVLTAEDLIAIIEETKEILKLIAVSKRKDLPTNVISELWKKQEDKIVIYLLKNKTSHLNTSHYINIINTYQQNDNILLLLIERNNLPEEIIQKLFDITSGYIKGKLSELYPEIPFNNGHQEPSQDPLQETNYDYKNQISLMEKKGVLTHSLLLRSLCEGNISFFEQSIGHLLKDPSISLMELLENKQGQRIQQLCEDAKFPAQLTQAIIIVLNFYQKMSSADNFNPREFPKEMLSYLEQNNIKNCDILLTYLKLVLETDKRISDAILEHLKVSS